MKKRVRNIKPPYSDEEIRILALNLQSVLSIRIGMPVKLEITAQLSPTHFSSGLDEYLKNRKKK